MTPPSFKELPALKIYLGVSAAESSRPSGPVPTFTLSSTTTFCYHLEPSGFYFLLAMPKMPAFISETHVLLDGRRQSGLRENNIISLELLSNISIPVLN